MPAWTLVNSSPTKGRTFKRQLDPMEAGLFWDSVFNGAADIVHHLRLRLLNEADAYIFSESNITRTWLSVKRRYPLLGARVEVDNEEPHFIVQEHHLGRLNPNEVVFGSVSFSSVEEAQSHIFEILDGPRSLSNNLLARIFIFHETDQVDVIHMFTLIAHCVTDGTACNSFLRCFLDTLSSHSEPPISGLEQRLAMVIASADLEPKQSFSLARRRWRCAIGFVIFGIRAAKRQVWRAHPSLSFNTLYLSCPSACSRSRDVRFKGQTTAILMNCRLNDTTFGNAFLPLAQVAMTRVLYRRYLRGEIDEKEWDYRKKQPHINRGPLNLRPYLDQQWFSKGGAGEFFLAISFFFYQLPFMTLGVTTQQHRDDLALSNGAPPFANLLTFNRFLHRANMVKRQAANFLNHPLFLEIASVEPITQLERTRIRALEWLKSVEEGTMADDTEVLAPADFPGTTWAHGGSSVGNNFRGILDGASSRTPGQLYLGAVTIHKQLHMKVFYDVNVFEEAIAREWLDEVRDAVVWYLGQSHADKGSVQHKL
ncbi:hypothetical protein BU15DRAFT_79099 [Melanogaster broomeanus]|nr:hypothetical protein BU15DRAFT_79099 [Melanogaster broomeanus]